MAMYSKIEAENPQEPIKTMAGKSQLPLVSIITPAFNEAGIITQNLSVICEYMMGLADQYRWEIIVINDGSRDETGNLAEQFASQRDNIKVYHHRINRGLGNALQTTFKAPLGDYVIVLDLDLSYSPDHIERLLDKIREKDADVVIASPYMKGGKCTNVPLFRLFLSKVVNRFMKISSRIQIHTFTGMARIYRGSFLKNLNLKAGSYDINPEIIHKAHILRAHIEEIPAHLDWTSQRKLGKSRTSSIKIYKGILSSLMSSFILRPYAFFMITGLALSMVAFYVIGWIFVHTFEVFNKIAETSDDRVSEAVATVFLERPYAFFVGGILLIIALQFLSIGFLSLQSKRYFDELFNINTTQLRRTSP